MISKYAQKVRRLLRQIYPNPQPILKEISLNQFSKHIDLSKPTRALIKRYEARLGRMKVDFWVKHHIAVEVHGEQHDIPIQFSNEIEDIESELVRRKGLDLVKQEVLKESGIPIIIVWYYEIKELTAESLKLKIHAAQQIADKSMPKKIQYKVRKRIPRLDPIQPKGAHTITTRTMDPFSNRRRTSPLHGDMGDGSKRLKGKPLGRRVIPKPPKGQSKLSRDWQRHKESQ